MSAACTIVALIGALSCSSSKATGPSATATGNLTVMLTAPSGATPSAIVTGPSGFQLTVTATQTITGLPVGSYTVVADSAVVTNAIVSTIDEATVSGSPAAVTANDTALVSVAYAAKPGTGGMWVLSGGGNEILPAQLQASGTPSLAVTLGGTAASSAGVAAFDASGNLWLENETSIVEYTVAQLAASATPTPAISITGSLLIASNGLFGMAFDHEGDLWVTDYATDSSTDYLMEYTPAQLAAGGSPTPAVVLSNPTGANAHFTGGIAFDAQDNLWVVGGSLAGVSNPLYASSSLLELPPAQRTASGAAAPTVNLVLNATLSPGGGQPGPEAKVPAFDVAGNLWATIQGATYGSAGSLIEIPAADLATSSTVTQSVTLTIPGATGQLSALDGLAFDNSGDAWITNQSDATNGVIELSAQQIATTGTPTPAVVLAGLPNPSAVAFDPHATGLPIAGASAVYRKPLTTARRSSVGVASR
jgi:hypothetical protein